MSHERTDDSDNQETQVIDFSKVRENKLDEKRRKTERIFFRQIVGIYTVVGENNLRQVEMVDVSEEGCSFQVPYDPNKPWPVEIDEMPLRLYFSPETYLPIEIKINNSRPFIEDGLRYMRYGCSVDKSMSSYPAFQQFVKFLKLYSLHARRDDGNVTFFYL